MTDRPEVIAAEVLFNLLRRLFPKGLTPIRPMHRDGPRILIGIGPKRYTIKLEETKWTPSVKS